MNDVNVPVIELPRLAFLAWVGDALPRLHMRAESLALADSLDGSELRGEPDPAYTYGDTPKTVGKFLHCEKAIYRIVGYDWRFNTYELVWPD